MNLVTYIKKHFRYDPKTGQVWRLFDNCSKLMLLKHKGGYISIRITIDKKVYHTYAHRVAWVLHYGKLPPQKLVIDHINHIRDDNRISNLRAISTAENGKNKLRECPYCGKPIRY